MCSGYLPSHNIVPREAVDWHLFGAGRLKRKLKTCNKIATAIEISLALHD